MTMHSCRAKMSLPNEKGEVLKRPQNIQTTKPARRREINTPARLFELERTSQVVGRSLQLLLIENITIFILAFTDTLRITFNSSS
jgi:hypothetical protein